MKRIFTLCMIVCIALTGFAQTDTTGKQSQTPEGDTIHIGGMIIIRKPGSKDKDGDKDHEYKIKNRKTYKKSNLSTNWWILDIGFSNYVDNTNYNSASAQSYASGSPNTPGIPASNKSWFNLKDGKSRNVNIWFFMQKLNIASHVVNLKYGLGLELNNYHFKQPIRFQANPPATIDPPRVLLDATTGRNYKKDKLAVDYLTAPIMLNFNFTPNRHEGFGLSAGISAGYLYSARNKTITSDEGKHKAKDDFELERWKLSYIAELSLGPVRFYGSYAFKNMFERGLDITPYNFGFRFSKF